MSLKTTLEKELLKAIDPYFEDGDGDEMVKATAKVCLRWIEKALRDSTNETFKRSNGSIMERVQDLYVKEWLKKNGL